MQDSSPLDQWPPMILAIATLIGAVTLGIRRFRQNGGISADDVRRIVVAAMEDQEAKHAMRNERDDLAIEVKECRDRIRELEAALARRHR